MPSTPPLPAGRTVFMYYNEQLAVLAGAVSVSLEARVEIRDKDYIVDTVRVSIRGDSAFDRYYECHLAESAGSRRSPLDA